MDYIIYNKPQTIDLRNKFNFVEEEAPCFRNIKKENDPYNPYRLFEGQEKYSTLFPTRNVEVKPLRNKLDGSFVVIASSLELADDLLRIAQRSNLTVSGDNTCKVGKGLGSIENIEKGNLITFGTSERFDVNWVSRRGYAYENGLVPVYDVVKDWNKILKAVKEMADEKQALATKREDDLLKGIRPSNPVYRTLKLNEVGNTYVTEQKKEAVGTPTVTTKKIYGTMVGGSFIKSGYKIIPVKEVRIQPTYEVAARPFAGTYRVEIRVNA